MRPFARTITALTLALMAAGCLSTANTGTRAGGSYDMLTEEQIRDTNHSNLFDVIRTLRSNWLHARGVDSFESPTQIQVYLDDVRLGGVQELRSIPPAGVSYVRYYDGIAASARWGLNHGAGVIFVSTRRE